MCASRSRTWERTAPGPILVGFAFLAISFLLLWTASHAFGATSTHKTTPADTTDEGFRVRVKEESRSVGDVRAEARMEKERARVEKDRARAMKGLPAAPEPPDVPDTPDTPEPPDTNLDIDTNNNGLVRFGEDITIPADKTIDGDVMAIGGNVTVYGRIKGDAVAIGGGVDIRDKGVVEGDAVSMGGSGVSTSDSASVGGKNVSVGSSPLHHGHIWPMIGIFGAVGTGIWILQTIVKLFLTLFFAWLVLLLARDRVVGAVDQMYHHFGKSFLWGLLGFAAAVVAIPTGIIILILVAVIAIVILAITIIGIPVAILLVIALVLGIIGLCLAIVVAMFVGFLNGAMFLGQRVLGRNTPAGQQPLRAIFIGLVVLTALEIAGKLMGLVGLLVFHPIAIALGVASGALAVILTIAGFGGLLTQPGLTGRIRVQWWPSRGHHTLAPGAPGTPVPPAPVTPGTPPVGAAPGTSAPASEPPPAGTPGPGPVTPEPPPEGGSSDAP